MATETSKRLGRDFSAEAKKRTQKYHRVVIDVSRDKWYSISQERRDELAEKIREIVKDMVDNEI